MYRTLELIVSVVLLIIPIFLFGMTFTDQFDVPTFGGDVGPAFAPRGYLVVWAALALFVTVSALRGKGDESDGDGQQALKLGQLMAVIAVAVVTALGMVNIGFVFATIPGFFLFCWAFGYRNIIPLAILSIVGPVAIWAAFTFLFELLLPRSPWFHTF